MHILVQYDDRPVDEFKPLLKNNENYCKSQNIQYLFLTKGYEHLPPWWRKVAIVKELLAFYESVLWVDSDATIVGHEHFATLFKDGHFVFSPNPPMVDHLEMFSAPMCAGVWGVKNTPEGHSIMHSWMSAYNPNAWTKNPWATTGAYAGENYEQGAFEIHIYRVADFQPWLQWYPWNVLNYLPRDDKLVRGRLCPTAFALHYWSGNRSHIFKHWPYP